MPDLPEARMRQEAVGKPGSVVADLDVELGAVGPGCECDDRTGGSEPQRVVDEVVDGLADPVRVDIGVGAGLNIDAAGDADCGQAGTGTFDAAHEQPSDVRPLQPQAEPILVAPGQQQEVIGEPGQPASAAALRTAAASS